MPGTIIPRRGTFSGTVVTLENCSSYAIMNFGANGLWIRNEPGDADAISTFVPAGASFSSPDSSPYYTNGLFKVVFDALALGADFSLEAICEIYTP